MVTADITDPFSGRNQVSNRLQPPGQSVFSSIHGLIQIILQLAAAAGMTELS